MHLMLILIFGLLYKLPFWPAIIFLILIGFNICRNLFQTDFVISLIDKNLDYFKKEKQTDSFISESVSKLREPFNCINLLIRKLDVPNERLSDHFRGTMRACILNVIKVSNSVSDFLENP